MLASRIADPVEVSATRVLMGGRVTVVLRDAETSRPVERDAERILDRVAAWAGRLTRFDAGSELSRLNAAGDRAPIGPTMTCVLDWARLAEDRSAGLVDVSMLDARLEAELDGGASDGRPATTTAPDTGSVRAGRRWRLERDRRGATVVREPGVRFDLDGVAKGWLADRALAIARTRSALVDGDGDIAARLASGDTWSVGIADPRSPDTLLATLRLDAGDGTRVETRTLGVATSGITVHRWDRGHGVTHHLIDPRTRRPAVTDVLQATVIAASARAAEVHAKSAVVAGADRAFELLDRPDVFGLLLLTERGDVRATPETTRWLV